MDIENLIESLQNAAGGPEGIKMCHAAATALSTLQTENKKLRAELENYRKGHREEAISTLTPPNEWVNRVRELDELYTKLQIITGFTVEQLLEMFAAGYTLEKPDYSKSFEEMASLAETTPPNEWVSVEERLPTDERPVLVFVGYADTMTGFITTSSYFCFDANPHWQWDGLVQDEQKTLFWMPLPEPPGKEG